jgi:hypothetical protein
MISDKGVNYQTVLSDLRFRRDRLNHAIAAIEEIVGETEPRVNGNAPLQEVSSPSGVYATMTIGDAAVHFIKSKGKKQKTGTIVRALQAGGLRSQSKKLYTTIYNTLSARANREGADVVKVGSDWDVVRSPQERPHIQ